MGADPGRAGRRRDHLAVGRRGELAAASFLARHGFRVIGTGFLARRGEIDLVCRRGERLVLVEVKTRTSDAFGAPAEAVGPRKRRALLAAAAEYRALAGWRGPIDFAVVSIREGEEPELIESVF
ncbi:MAG TPA: YraN family protein [Candidatus Dormibacteraeota bacterium]|nr:YraN family protein [Candidatus Dormibacteraeota bacterium]